MSSPNFVVYVGGRAYELDFAWPHVRVGLEVSPFFTHGSEKTQLRDLEKRRALKSVGWTIIEATDPDLVSFKTFAVVVQLLGNSGVILAL